MKDNYCMSIVCFVAETIFIPKSRFQSGSGPRGASNFLPARRLSPPPPSPPPLLLTACRGGPQITSCHPAAPDRAQPHHPRTLPRAVCDCRLFVLLNEASIYNVPPSPCVRVTAARLSRVTCAALGFSASKETNCELRGPRCSPLSVRVMMEGP